MAGKPDRRLRPGVPVGFALVRDAEVLGAEPFFHGFTAGLESVLAPLGVPVLVQVVATIGQAGGRIRRWAEADQAQGAILIDLLPADERVALVKRLGLPAVVVGDPATADGLTAVWSQDDVAMRRVVETLVAAGHRRLGHVAGPAQMAHSIIRRRTFLDAARGLGVAAVSWDGDYSYQAGARAAAAAADLPDRPTALVFDNDVMALAALGEAGRRGLRVPDDLSLVAWDDSALCQLAQPPLSAVSHDVQAFGQVAAEALVAVLDGAAPSVVEVPAAELVERGSTAPPVNS